MIITMGVVAVPRLYTFLLIPALLAAMLLAACGDSGSDDESASNDDGWSAEAISASQGEVLAQQVGSQLGLGPTRVAFGVLVPDPKDPQSALLVHDATVHATFYKLDGEKGTPAGEYDLTPVVLRENTKHLHGDGANHLHDDPLATVYVTNLNLDTTEWWGADLSITIQGKEHDGVRVRFFVSEKTTEPGIGDPVPSITQLTNRDVADVAMIDSSTPPRPEMHELTVAEAVKNGKPSVIAFATPAFCQTRFCGPVVDAVVAPLQAKYGDRVNFLHIEPYKLAEARKGRLIAIPEMEQWGLASEPWVFVLDASGEVAAKYEGIMSQEEVEPVLQRVLSGQAAALGERPLIDAQVSAR